MIIQSGVDTEVSVEQVDSEMIITIEGPDNEMIREFSLKAGTLSGLTVENLKVNTVTADEIRISRGEISDDSFLLDTDVKCAGTGIISTVTDGVGYATSSVWSGVRTVVTGTGFLVYDSVATVSLGMYNGAKSLASWVLSHYY